MAHVSKPFGSAAYCQAGRVNEKESSPRRQRYWHYPTPGESGIISFKGSVKMDTRVEPQSPMNVSDVIYQIHRAA
jgi:hypothetical protein